MGSSAERSTARRSFVAGRVLVVLASAFAIVFPASALAHVERASYWPDPAPDCSVDPCAGGEVPTARLLASAIAEDRGSTRVVCQRNSLTLAQRSIATAQRTGYVLRPSLGPQTLSAREGRALLDVNRKLSRLCRFRSIQEAINQSGNNDRVVIMPGLYTEPQSRAAPTFDSRCDQYEITNDRGDPVALSYKYQVHCPNDQNLIAVLGREPGATDPPELPFEDRHGIPDLGPCIRCNLQIEGSGVGPDDVIIDAGRVKSGDGAPRGSVKDVGIRVDRADGTVIRNVKVRHAREHNIYVLESDGYLLDRFEVFFPGEYGVLTFVGDHGLMQNCEAVGADDSGLYPGAGADTGVGRDSAPQEWKDYEDPGYSYGNFRYSQEIRYCDSHHNASGYSGTDGNAVHLHHNNIYDNVLGFTTDVFTAAGHPGFPQDSDLVEYNNFYSNNFDGYHAQPAETEVFSGEPFPIGVGLWIAGGNDNVIRYNHFWDNWRRGTMAFAVPDQVVCGPGVGIDPAFLAGCNPNAVPPSTSYRNEFYGNVMGRAPSVAPPPVCPALRHLEPCDGWEPGEVAPNGTGNLSEGRVDFWWDEYTGNTGNCWHDNVGQDGTAGSITSLPPSPPPGSPANAPHVLPHICDDTSVGAGAPAQESELGNCLVAFTVEPPFDSCPWFTKPSDPSP
jgi:Right handed beta helix region